LTNNLCSCLWGWGSLDFIFRASNGGILFRILAPTSVGVYTEWPKKMYTLFTHQYLWNILK